ncbi:TAP42 (YMR028W) [Zygosaccharomyces parabailii]|nr:TAP42 (YMR028W) [Zygosaccharomyces parabailii]
MISMYTFTLNNPPTKNTMTTSEDYDTILKIYQTQIEHSTLRQDSLEFQNTVNSTIERLLSLKSIIHDKLALFSSNETVEDIATKSLKFLSIDYYLALLFSKKQMSQLNDAIAKNKMKLKFLEKTIQLFMQFLVTLQDYEILDSFLSKKVESFEETYSPSLNDLYSQPNHNEDLSGAQKKRQQKIEMFRHSKEMNEKLTFIESKFKSGEINDNDEEQLRELYIQKLQTLSYQAFTYIEQTLYEVELLRNFTRDSSTLSQALPAPPKEVSEDDGGYTEKLESLNKPLLSKQGKVLRNFTLVDQKTKLQKKVRGYGQYGPTMSVEEFLEKEWEESRILQGGEETQSKEKNEDDMGWQDEETYKARKWDEFKESVPRGSGNTMNRG